MSTCFWISAVLIFQMLKQQQYQSCCLWKVWLCFTEQDPAPDATYSLVERTTANSQYESNVTRGMKRFLLHSLYTRRWSSDISSGCLNVCWMHCDEIYFRQRWFIKDRALQKCWNALSLWCAVIKCWSDLFALFSFFPQVLITCGVIRSQVLVVELFLSCFFA